MLDDAEILQARTLLKELRDQVERVSRKLEIVEQRHQRRSARGIAHVHRQQSELRRELREAHRLMDGLHRRYPETLGYRDSATRAATANAGPWGK